MDDQTSHFLPNLREAVNKGDATWVDNLLGSEHNPGGFLTSDTSLENPFFLALAKGHLDIAQKLYLAANKQLGEVMVGTSQRAIKSVFPEAFAAMVNNIRSSTETRRAPGFR